MVDFVDSLGENAGTVWKVLDRKGPQLYDDLLRSTSLDNDELHCAVGWLAKEGRICRSGSNYMLGETNLVDKIGVDAGMVWEILDMWGDVDITSIARLAKIDESDVFCAIGWLAREDKIGGKKPGSVKGNFLFWLK